MPKKVTTEETSLVKWEKELADLAVASAGIEESVQVGNFIGTKGGQLSYRNQPIPGNKMEVVVLDHILANMFYKGRFDADNPTGPVCFAFGLADKELAPHEKCVEPQSDTGCHDCQHNEFGSADTGKGKACKNSRRIALIPAGNLEAIENEEPALLHIPPTSVQGWAAYVQALKQSWNMPPIAFITEVSTVPDNKVQFRVLFKQVEQVNPKYMGALLKKRKDFNAQLYTPFVYIEPTAPTPARGSRDNSKFAGRDAGKSPAAARGRGR